MANFMGCFLGSVFGAGSVVMGLASSKEILLGKT